MSGQSNFRMSSEVVHKLGGVFAMDRPRDFPPQQPTGLLQSEHRVRPGGGVRGVCWSKSGDCHAQPARVGSRLDLHHRQVLQALIGHPRKNSVQSFQNLPAELRSLAVRTRRSIPRFVVECPRIGSIFGPECGRRCLPTPRGLLPSLQGVYSGRGKTCRGAARIVENESGASRFLLPGVGSLHRRDESESVRAELFG